MPNFSGVWTLQEQYEAILEGNWTGIEQDLLFTFSSNNSQGQQGAGDTVATSSPIQIGSDTWADVATSDNASFGVTTEGELYAWGENGNGQLGDGTVIAKSSPVQIGSDTDWATVAGSSSQDAGFSIKTDGTLWAWGSNITFGRLGDGTVINKSSPVQIGALTNWAQIDCGANHTMAVKTDGTMWAWGQGYFGQTGLNIGFINTYRSSPVQVGSLTTWSKVVCTSSSTLAVKTDGTMWSFGGNGNGVLGQNDRTRRSSPTQVGALTNWSDVAACYVELLAVKTDGTLWAVGGSNGSGELALNDRTPRSSPVQVGALTTWEKVFGGLSHAFGITTSGELYSWGTGGATGHNDTINRSSPVQVGSSTGWLKAIGGDTHSVSIFKGRTGMS